MSVIEKLSCDICPGEDPIVLNHIYTLRGVNGKLELSSGILGQSEDEIHACSITCLNTGVGRGAAGSPIKWGKGA